QPLQDSQRLRLLVRGDLGDVLHGRGGDARLLEPPEPSGPRVGGEPLSEQALELGAMRNSIRIGREASVDSELREAKRLAQRAEESIVSDRHHELAVGAGKGPVGSDRGEGGAVATGRLASREVTA